MTDYLEKLKLEQMNLSGIPLKFIYQIIHEDDRLEKTNLEINYIYENLGIQIKRNGKKYLDVNIYENGLIKDKIYDLLHFPIIVFFDNQYIDVVSLEQFENIPELLNIKEPLLKCSKNSQISQIFSFGFLVKHSSCKSLISIVLKENLSKSNQIKKRRIQYFFPKDFPYKWCISQTK